MTRRTFLAAFGAAPVYGGKLWEDRKFPHWTKAEVHKLLTDSPWARPVRLSFELSTPPRLRESLAFSDVALPPGIGLPRGGGLPGTGWPGGVSLPRGGGGGGAGSVRAEAYLTVRWSSALPIKQAVLLDAAGDSTRIPAEALDSVTREEPYYTVEVFGLPAIAVHTDTSRLARQLERNAALVRQGRRPLSVEAVEIPPYGEHLRLTFRFPKTDTIAIEDKSVDLFASADPFEFRTRFKLAEMVYVGTLAL